MLETMNHIVLPVFVTITVLQYVLYLYWPSNRHPYFQHKNYNFLIYVSNLGTVASSYVFFEIILNLFYLHCEASSHNLFKSLLGPLPGTNQYWCHMRNHRRDLCGVRTHDLRLRGRHLDH